MGILEVVAAFLKIAGTLLDLHAKNSLTREQLDAAVANLHGVPPPKTGDAEIAILEAHVQTLKAAQLSK